MAGGASLAWAGRLKGVGERHLLAALELPQQAQQAHRSRCLREKRAGLLRAPARACCWLPAERLPALVTSAPAGPACTRLPRAN
eukprot:COSAG04_NODE_524_length_13127_cov_18.191511_16_plen_84_part_00